MRNKNSVSRPASLRGKPYLCLRVILESVMQFDPSYLFQELTRKASLGVLSAGGNFCMGILAKYHTLVKERKV